MAKNYFQLLGLELNFDVDKKVLTDNYRKLQAQFHPDKFSNSSDMEKRLSVQHSSQINDAFQTIKNPLNRAIYLLSLIGMVLKDNETTSDPAFLMQQMDLREQLDNIRIDNNSADGLDKMQQQVAQSIRQSIANLSQLFNSIDGQAQPQDLEEIKKLIIKMQFLNKLQQQCEDLEEDLENQF